MASLNTKKLLKLQKSSSSNSLASSRPTSFTNNSHDQSASGSRVLSDTNKSDSLKLDRNRQLNASLHLNDLVSNRNKTFDNFHSRHDMSIQKISDFVTDFMSDKTKMLT